MRATIKEVDEAFKAFCTKHSMINSYKSFNYDGESKNNVYPMLWCGMDDVVIPKGEGSLSPTIPCLMFVGPEIGDKATMVSEAVQLANDFVNYFSENEDIYKFSCDIATSFRIVDNKTDLSIAAIFELKLMIRDSQNRCAIPFD